MSFLLKVLVRGAVAFAAGRIIDILVSEFFAEDEPEESAPELGANYQENACNNEKEAKIPGVSKNMTSLPLE